MKVTRAQADENRERIVDVASRLFRERGVDGVGVDAVMQAAGLTHGGFYRNFESKEALVVEACRRAIAESAGKQATDGSSGKSDLKRWITDYLSPQHCASAGGGCAFPGLAVDAGRRTGPVRGVFASGLAAAVERLSQLLPGRPDARRRRALASMAGLVGAIRSGSRNRRRGATRRTPGCHGPRNSSPAARDTEKAGDEPTTGLTV